MYLIYVAPSSRAGGGYIQTKMLLPTLLIPQYWQAGTPVYNI